MYRLVGPKYSLYLDEMNLGMNIVSERSQIGECSGFGEEGFVLQGEEVPAGSWWQWSLKRIGLKRD